MGRSLKTGMVQVDGAGDYSVYCAYLLDLSEYQFNNLSS